MGDILSQWQQAAHTTLGLFWMAFWAFGLGYLISSMIQVFVTKERMRKSMGKTGAKSVGLGTFFGFISSSCSFAALSTTRALFSKGAGLIPSLAFLLASTNLVIELGIVIAVFLGWQFVVGEYVGGALLILATWLLVKLTRSKKLEDEARENAKEAEGHKHDHGGDDDDNWRKLIASKEGWRKVANKYVMEWSMVWKDVTIGFTVAGIIATFVPTEFFQTLFVGAGQDDASFFEILLQTIAGPLAAFFTFIGSMGNIPLAAVLFGQGVSFAGVMAFIFSDLVVFPVLRIQAKYYGWKMAFYILAIFLAALVTVSVGLHYAFDLFNMLPDSAATKTLSERDYFALDYTSFLNIGFIAISVGFLSWHLKNKSSSDSNRSVSDWIMLIISGVALTWLFIGAAVLPLLKWIETALER